MLRYVVFIVLIVACIEVGRQVDSSSVWLLLTLFSLFAILTYILMAKVKRNGRFLFLAIIALILVARSSQTLPPSSFEPNRYSGQNLKLHAVVTEDIEVSQKSTRIVLDSISINDQKVSRWHGKIMLTMPLHAPLEYGDAVYVEGKLKDLNTIEDAGYKTYLYHHQIYGLIDWPTVIVQSKGNGNRIIGFGIKIQQAVNEKINRLMPQDAAAFLGGVVLGSKQPISKTFSDDLKTTGTNHLIVASGYNISILIALLIKISRYMSKKCSVILVLAMIACYTITSGLDPSIIRAAVMASVGLLATSLGRQREALYTMILAGVIMLLINPLWIYDAGFQLSFAATFGIISLQPYIFSKLKFISNLGREAISTTLAAQIFVYPIIIVTFGQVSTISLITNVLVVWVIPVIMFGGIITMLLAFIFSPLSQISATLIYPFILYTKEVIKLTADTPFALIYIPNISWVIAAIYYAVIYYLYQIKVVHEKNISDKPYFNSVG